jgi:hypothetical protein
MLLAAAVLPEFWAQDIGAATQLITELRHPTTSLVVALALEAEAAIILVKVIMESLAEVRVQQE